MNNLFCSKLFKFFSVDLSSEIAEIDDLNVWLECESYCWSLIGTNNIYVAVSNDEDLVPEPLSRNKFIVKLTQTPMSKKPLTPKTAKDGKFVLHYTYTGVKYNAT